MASEVREGGGLADHLFKPCSCAQQPCSLHDRCHHWRDALAPDVCGLLPTAHPTGEAGRDIKVCGSFAPCKCSDCRLKDRMHYCANCGEHQDKHAPPTPASSEEAEPRIYPCSRCGTMRTKSEGGTTFTICEECWDAAWPPSPTAPPAAVEEEPEGCPECYRRGVLLQKQQRQQCAELGCSEPAPPYCARHRGDWIERAKAFTSAESENARLREELEDLKALDQGKSPCGHWAAYAHTDDGGKNIVCLLCQNERLRTERDDALCVLRALGVDAYQARYVEGEPIGAGVGVNRTRTVDPEDIAAFARLKEGGKL